MGSMSTQVKQLNACVEPHHEVRPLASGGTGELSLALDASARGEPLASPFGLACG
jgi:hypothetical protein